MDRAKKSWGLLKYARETFNIALTSMQTTHYEQPLEKKAAEFPFRSIGRGSGWLVGVSRSGRINWTDSAYFNLRL
jgi:hypothetical protein